MAADKGFELTSDEINQFISQMNENDEFDDIELSNEALAAVAGGKGTADQIIEIVGGTLIKMDP